VSLTARDLLAGLLIIRRAVYAGSSLHYREMIKSPRWEDMDIQYLNVSVLSPSQLCTVVLESNISKDKNMFAFMGIGRHFAQSVNGNAKSIDISPYTSLQNVDLRLFRNDDENRVTTEPPAAGTL
jgi:hypothetical protein